MGRVWFALAVLAVLGVHGCSNDPGTGPKDVKWDRDACERCRMVLSDRRHGAQVRFDKPNGKSQVHFFDDIGCALVWLEDKPFREAPSTEIWVGDWHSGDWIDARTATYLAGQMTPMEYGLGAQPKPAQGGLDFERARAHVFEVERRFNVHGGHLEAAPSSR